MTGTSETDGDMIDWVAFPGKQAILKRLVDHKGNQGLILRVADNEAGAGVMGKALECGFKKRSAANLLTMIFKRGQKIPFTVPQLAGMIGGVVARVPRDRLRSGDMVINLHERAPRRSGPDAGEDAAPSGKSAAIVPDPDSMERLGLNSNGEEVVRDHRGRFRRVVKEDGSHEFIHESAGDPPALHLRARRPEDLGGIAAGLLRAARKGTVHRGEFERILDAALEDGADGAARMDRGGAFDSLRGQLLRKIADVATGLDPGMSPGKGNDRSNFHMALRLSANTGAATSLPAAGEGDRGEFRPGAAMLSFLSRYSSRGSGRGSVDFEGSGDLRVAFPRLSAEDASLQVRDFSGIPAAGAADYAMNLLSRRPAEGASIFIFPADVPEEHFERLRSEVGRAYGIEVVAEIASGVAEGSPGGRNYKIFFVGDRRPEPLESLPRAALRWFTVAAADDLVSLEGEIARSRGRIQEFNRGEAGVGGGDAEDARDENVRQRPYRPLSEVGEPFTMIPRALEGATSKALNRVARDTESLGGVDASVARALGRSVADLGDILTPEQIDAVALRMNAAERGRGFLEADQTGVGKGRTMAALVKIHLREKTGNRCLYLTESASINVPDVLRDLKAVDGLKDARILLLTSGSEFVDVTVDPATGNEVHREMLSPNPRRRREIYASGAWPEACDLIITTYSQFNVAEDRPQAEWLAASADADTLFVLDEAHNALNPRSNTGRNFRAALRDLPARNVVYATGTPARNPRGMDLYHPLLPRGEAANLDGITESIASGGEVAQEAFATMLAEDGVMIRRDHDLSATDYQVDLPDDRTMLEYQDTMNRFSPIVEEMIDVSTRIGEIVGRVQAVQFRRMVDGGMDERQARSMTNELSQYSLSIGGPLSNLARIVMNAIKVDQVVKAAIAERDSGRKPLITFHSTNAGLLEETSRDRDDGRRLTDAELAGLEEMTIRDQIRRIHKNIYKMKVEGEIRDPRDDHPDIQEAFDRIEALIDEIPDLPVSPVDALIERLEANEISTGEISGRSLCYRGGRIRRRSGRGRRETVDLFNSGEIDALLYNSAGATGGSYHAGATFKDQTPRTLIEFEAPIDIIKYVQAQGRGNRYDQVAAPKVLSVMTGLTPEMRILQQRNGKLRSLGASVDGNRSHPLLLDDVPDLLNKVGDEATRNVLLSAPGLARRLGFPRFAEEEMLEVAEADGGNDRGSGVAKSGLESLANKVLARSIMLPAHEQDDLIQRIRMEFDVLIEELESRNANPLRPKEFGGVVDIRTTTIFSGQELEDDDLDTSVFLSPVYMSTGEHDLGEDPVAVDRLVSMVERAIAMHGSDGLRPHAERIIQNMEGLLRPYLPVGHDMETALEDPAGIPGRFAREHEKMDNLARVLGNLQPGVSIRFPSASDPDGLKARTVVDLVPPRDPSHYDIPSAYKIRTICPGDSKPETIAVSRILTNRQDDIQFRPGLSDGFSDAYLREFSAAAQLRRLMPVQILGGNILRAITIANQHDLGTISLYRDIHGRVNRGILVHDAKIDMTMLPVPLPGATVAAEVVTRFARFAAEQPGDGIQRHMRVWGSMDPGAKDPGPRNGADLIIRLTARSAKIDMIPLRVSNRDFYLSRPGFYEAVHGEPMPDAIPDRASRKPGTNHKYLAEFGIDTPEGRNRLYTVMEHLSGVPMMTDGAHRDLVNETMEGINRDGPRGREMMEAGTAVTDGGERGGGPDGESVATDGGRSEWEPDFEGVEF